jgi:hypothetical protein
LKIWFFIAFFPFHSYKFSMSKTVAEYAASPIANAYVKLKEEFRKAKEFRENAARGGLPLESLGHDDAKPSGRAYLVFAGTIVTLLVPLKIIGCSVSLLLNYAYSPVTIILTGLLLLFQKIGWVERVMYPGDFSTASKCIFLVAFWPTAISMKMVLCTTAEKTGDSTIYLHKLHFLQGILGYSLLKK